MLVPGCGAAVVGAMVGNIVGGLLVREEEIEVNKSQ